PVYHGKNRFNTITYRTGGMTVEDRPQIRKVSAEEAMWRLGKGPQPEASPMTATSGNVATANDRVREQLQAGKKGGAKPQPVLGRSHRIRACAATAAENTFPGTGGRTVEEPADA